MPVRGIGRHGPTHQPDGSDSISPLRGNLDFGDNSALNVKNINGTDGINFDNSNVGIGTTSPKAKLDVPHFVRLGETDLPISFRLIYMGKSGDLGVISQGIAWDGTYFYQSRTSALLKRNEDLSLVISNTSPLPPNTDHIGDIDVYNGKIYAPVEHFGSCSDFGYQQIVLYNTSDLSFVESHDVSAQGHEVSGLAIDPDEGVIYVTSYCDANKIFKYSLTDFSYLGYISLSKPISFIQGIALRHGYFYISSDSPPHSIWRVSKDGTQAVEIAGLTTGEMEGLTWKTDTELRLLRNEGGEAHLWTLSIITEYITIGTSHLYLNTPDTHEVLTLSSGSGHAVIQLFAGDSLRSIKGTPSGLELGGSLDSAAIIDPSGNVGIGTMSPSDILHIYKTGISSRIIVQTTETAGTGDEAEIDLKSGENYTRLFYRDYDNNFGIYHGVGGSNATRFRIDGSGNIHLYGNVHCTGKLTSNGGYDPAYVLYDYQTRKTLIELVRKEISPNKLGGAVLFFNGERQSLELFLPLKGEFRSLNGKLLEKTDPITETFEVEKRYYFDEETGEVGSYEVKKNPKKYKLKAGVTLDPTTGKLKKTVKRKVKKVIDGEEKIVEAKEEIEITKDEAIEEVKEVEE